MKYAGIGSRKITQQIIGVMHFIAFRLAPHGFILRSGRAKGADTAFEKGCIVANGKHELFTADDVRSTWFDHAASFHPNWENCTPYIRCLHARNSAIMLGANLDDPVKFVVCWTENGKAIGGTGQALRIAEHMNIPIYNLHNFARFNDLQRDLGIELW